MNPSSSNRTIDKPCKQSGMALVITLSLVVLVTIAAMAFFARATMNRGIESSRANQVLVQQIASSAADYTTSLFLREITNNVQVHASNGIPSIYQITNAAGMVPRRALAQTAMTNDTNFANLVRQSVPTADIYASADSTAGVSKNARVIPAHRWNAPMLLWGGGFSSTNQVPNWIYLNKDGTATNSSSANTIGRFAYNAYDTSGLLDINVAGYPSSVSGTNLACIKGTPVGTDLSFLAGVSSSDGFVGWRNTNHASSASSYVAAVQDANSKGFLRPSAGDQGILSRKDLIKNARSGAYGIDTNALPNLTHFSREKNAPSWSPRNPTGSSIDYAAEANVPTKANRFFPNVRVKAAFSRADGTTAVVGEPLIKTRFPLSKLAWLGFSGPVAPGTDATIQRDFGLAWDAANTRWNYVGHSGNSIQNAIKTLDEVANDNREPNFFELLKAGILTGSVGKSSESPTMAGIGALAFEDDNDMQIIRIGACIMDQADADNYPTSLGFFEVSSKAVITHGVEDLPYLLSMLSQPRWKQDPPNQYPNDAAPPTTAPPLPYTISMAVIWTPKLWNPHAQSSPMGGSPGAIRVRISSGVLDSVKHNPLNMVGDVAALDINNSKPLPSNSIEIQQANFEAFRNSVSVPESTNASPSSALSFQLPWWDPTDKRCGFVVHDVNQQAITLQRISGAQMTTGHSARMKFSGVMVVLEYLDGSGNWRVYDTLVGSSDFSSLTGISKTIDTTVSSFWLRTQNKMTLGGFYSKWDPRTTRWGPSSGWSWGGDDPPPVSEATAADKIMRRDLPFSHAPSDGTGVAFGRWPQGHTGWDNAGIFSLVPGSDGVFRPNDAYRADSANPVRDLTAVERRPVILQRPFLSVGELGYAFRDTPWQTLSFFDETSADAALLDLFCVSESPGVAAGRVNINKVSRNVLEGILSHTGMAPNATLPVNAADLAEDLLAFRDAQPGKAILNKDALVQFVSSSEFDSSNSSEVLKIRREAVVRGLVDSVQTRTWNLLIDVVAQSGRFTSTTYTPDMFLVEGEQRCWLHLAVDRFTGEVVDTQLEPVPE